MTIGTFTYDPNGRFAFPRSYIFGIKVAQYTDTVTRVANTFTVHAIPPDPTTLTFRFDPRFFVWTSNRWTLDHIMLDCYVLAGGVPPEIPFGGKISWSYDHSLHRAVLLVDWFAGTPNYFYAPLPSQPLNYWLPPPLP